MGAFRDAEGLRSVFPALFSGSAPETTCRERQADHAPKRLVLTVRVQNQQPCAHLIKQGTVVTDQHHGALPTCIRIQHLLEPFGRGNIQVVGRFIQHQHVGCGGKQPCENQPRTFATGKVANTFVLRGTTKQKRTSKVPSSSCSVMSRPRPSDKVSCKCRQSTSDGSNASWQAGTTRF